MTNIIIEDSDREASLRVMRWLYCDSKDPRDIAVYDAMHLEGDNDDHFVVEQFAAARLQERERAAKVMRDEIAKLEKQYDQHRRVGIANQKIGIARCLMRVEAPERAASLKQAGQEIAAAIRGQS